MTQPVYLTEPGVVDRLISDCRAVSELPVLIVVDTYARCLVGNENAQEDASAFVRALDRLRVELGCAWLLNHHTGNENTDRERGSTVLRDAADARLTVKRDTPGSLDVRLVCVKMKDDARFEDIPLHLEPYHDSLVVTLGEPLPTRKPFEETSAPPGKIAGWIREQPNGSATVKQIHERWGLSDSGIRTRRPHLAKHGIRYLKPPMNGGRAVYIADPAPARIGGVSEGAEDPTPGDPSTPTGGLYEDPRGGVGGDAGRGVVAHSEEGDAE